LGDTSGDRKREENLARGQEPLPRANRTAARKAKPTDYIKKRKKKELRAGQVSERRYGVSDPEGRTNKVAPPAAGKCGAEVKRKKTEEHERNKI